MIEIKSNKDGSILKVHPVDALEIIKQGGYDYVNPPSKKIKGLSKVVETKDIKKDEDPGKTPPVEDKNTGEGDKDKDPENADPVVDADADGKNEEGGDEKSKWYQKDK